MPHAQEPNAVDLRARIRAWLRYYRAQLGLSQRELGQAMGFSEATISNLLRDVETPGLDCLVRMHFRLGADLQQVLRSDPPVAGVQNKTTRAK